MLMLLQHVIHFHETNLNLKLVYLTQLGLNSSILSVNLTIASKKALEVRYLAELLIRLEKLLAEIFLVRILNKNTKQKPS